MSNGLDPDDLTGGDEGEEEPGFNIPVPGPFGGKMQIPWYWMQQLLNPDWRYGSFAETPANWMSPDRRLGGLLGGSQVGYQELPPTIAALQQLINMGMAQ
ncbi:MAG: hypothetical protein E3J64_06065, partial [Anaerolineales bacterium]